MKHAIEQLHRKTDAQIMSNHEEFVPSDYSSFEISFAAAMTVFLSAGGCGWAYIVERPRSARKFLAIIKLNDGGRCFGTPAKF